MKHFSFKYSVMKFLWFLAVACCFYSVSRAEYGDQEYLEKQKDLLVVLKYVHQPLWNSELYKFGKSYLISEDYENYNNVEEVKKFVKLLEKKTLLEKRSFFSIYNPLHLKQAKLLFTVLINAKNYETLARVASWARFNVNEKMFMYILGLISVHRDDLKTLIMPPPYEMCPFQFVNGEVIKQAQRVAMQGFHDAKIVNGYKEVIIPMNYTGWYLRMNEDLKLTYLTEDPTWNAMYYNYNLNYPFWMKGAPFGLDKDRRGEIFLSVHQFNIARYYLERLANNLGEIENFNWRTPIKSGYHPFLMLVNGEYVKTRDNFHSLYKDQNLKDILHAEDHERRIRNIIAQSFYTHDGEKVELFKPEMINEFGNLIQGNADAKFDHHFISRLIVPKFLENAATAARDPLFYQYYNHILNLYWDFMSNIEPYKKEEIGFPGVEITNVEVDKIQTFFEEKDIDISNAIEVPPDPKVNSVDEVTDVNFRPDDVFVKMRYQRLNYKPFEMKFKVNSDKNQKASLRIFIGPRDESMSKTECFEQHRKYFYVIDADIIDLKTGENLIVRKYPKSDVAYENEQISYFDLYKKVLAAKSGEEQWSKGMHRGKCAIVDHLRFPRGKLGGMKYQIMTVISPYKKTESASSFDPATSCGVGSGQIQFLDNHSLLFPIDREINPFAFYAPNLNLQEVDIHFQQFK